MRASIDVIRARRDEVRPDARIDLGFMAGRLYIGKPTWDVGEWTRTGSPEALAASLREAHDFGCSVLYVRFRSRSCDELCDQVAAFGAEVAPLLPR
jgi:hypothetical protein